MAVVSQLVSATLTSAPWTKWVDNGSTSAPAWVLGTVTTLATLAAKGGTITLDDGWSPYGQATIVIKLPDQATLDLIDPRTNTPAAAKRIVVTATRAGVVRTYDLLIIDRSADYVAGELTIVAATDEAALQLRKFTTIYSITTGSVWSYAGGPIAQGIRESVFEIAGLWPAPLYALPRDYPLDVVADGTWGVDGQLNYDLGDEFWDVVAAALLPANLRLYCDESRNWHLVPAIYNAGAEVFVRHDINIVAADDEISTDSDSWGDGVLAHYSWQVYSSSDGTWTTKESWDFYSPNPAGVSLDSTLATHPIVVEVTGKKSSSTTAKSIWARRAGRGRSSTLRTTVGIGTTPGQPLTSVPSPTVNAQLGQVRSVEFDLASDEITIVSRDLITAASSRAWLAQRPGVSWASVATGTAWPAYTLT